MPEKTRPCPQCGGTMSFRLGEYQCGSCSYSESGAAPPEERRGPQLPPSQWESRVSRSTRGTRTPSAPAAPGGVKPVAAPTPWTSHDAQEEPTVTTSGFTSWEAGFHEMYEGKPGKRGKRSGCFAALSLITVLVLSAAGLLMVCLG